MKSSKFLSSATLVIAVMAIVQIASAQASSTALCGAHEEPCAAANGLEKVHLSASNPIFLFTSPFFQEIRCESSLAQFQVLALASPQVLHSNGGLTWANCQQGSEECEIKLNSEQSAFLLLVLRTALSLGIAEFHGLEIDVECSFLDCIYLGLPSLHFEGAKAGSNGALTANEIQFEEAEGQFGCPETMGMDARYEPSASVHIST